MYQIVDLTQPWGFDTPPFVGYESPKIWYTHRLPYHGVVAERIETDMHTGTHMDAPLHFAPNGKDIAGIPLEQLYGEGVIVDISGEVGEWGEIFPDHITRKIQIREGDILIYYTGWQRYYTYGKERNEEYYFCHHPGGTRELAEWIVDMRLKWTGCDCGSADNPMNTYIRNYRPDITAKYEERIGMKVEEKWPRSGLYLMHTIVFPHNIPHIENIGGDIEKILNRRCMIGAFPWKFVGGSASICRVVAFLD